MNIFMRCPPLPAAAIRLLGLVILPGFLAAANPALTSQPIGPIPPASVNPVDFARDIVPMLRDSCAQCHANGHAKGGLKLDSRSSILKGGDSGPAVLVGQSEKSLLILLVSGQDPDRIMPKKGHPLSPRQIGMLRIWIDAGLTWPEGFVLSQWKQAPLAPRRPDVPAAAPGSGLSNPIDLVLQPYFAAHAIHPAAVVNDRVFVRRVYLDVIGLLPPVEALNQFDADAAPDKRQRLVERLLAQDASYAEHWLSFWNDLLRNDYQGTGYIDGGRKQITPWLYDALVNNKPYDQFVRELATGANGADGFIKGIVWRGVVNAAQTPQMQAAQNVSQVFMGVNLKCASCHDSFVSNWKLSDSYGLAGVFADKPIGMERCNVPTGQTAPLHFLYPQLGAIDPTASRDVRARQLASAITSPQNGRLTRTIVNRLWQKFFGRGIVEPVDEMDNDPWDADLLDYLASNLADNHYDLKKTIALMLTSRAYQLPAVTATEESAGVYVFAGPSVRRLSAEQFVDAICTLTGVPAGNAAIRLAAPPAKQALAMSLAVSGPPVRVAVCPADPLTTALGRPNREQVMTERPTAASTLQGLEMTNGGTLARLLHDGAANIVRTQARPEEMVRAFYQKALGREPNASELQDASSELGTPVKAEAVEDLLWAMVMLPDFQLIR